MAVVSLREAAALLGVSDDTLRRWADTGRIQLSTTPSGHRGVAGTELARVSGTLAPPTAPRIGPPASARNRLRGIVTAITRDTVMAQVEMQCGPHRVVSLVSREAADQLGLEVGSVAVATVKATNVGIELSA